MVLVLVMVMVMVMRMMMMMGMGIGGGDIGVRWRGYRQETTKIFQDGGGGRHVEEESGFLALQLHAVRLHTMGHGVPERNGV